MLTSEAGGTNKKKKKRKHDAEKVNSQPHVGDKKPSVGSHEARKQEEAVEAPATSPQLPDNGGPEIEPTHEKPAKWTDIDNKDEDAAGKAPEEGRNQPVLPWMRLPVKIEAGQGVPLEDVRGLDERLQTALKSCGFVELFPVQAAAWQVTAGGHSAAHDLCISAPTGSGKTLAYVLPLLQGLIGRCVPRLRCLIVLPTRDLAAQVFKVFAELCPVLGLRVGLAAAQASVGTEAATLFPDATHNRRFVHGRSLSSNDGVVDILVATPGRLMAHLKGTPGATLDHLRYLVIDETDRLLRQAYQDWLPYVTAATADACRDGGDLLTGGPRRRVLKIVASATLTRDPSKIERLGLHCPRYIALGATDHRYALPKSLKEFKVVCAGADKPLVTIALLRQLVQEPTLVFTASVESTRRLYVLLSAVASLKEHVLEFSSLNSGPERAAALAAFRGGAARILVASDGMTRGMDVPSVANVVNYDAPVYAKTYVHRAGRTARGGREGRVFTVLRVEEVRHFKGLLRKVDNTFVKDHALSKALVEAARPEAQHALSVLQAYLASEE